MTMANIDHALGEAEESTDETAAEEEKDEEEDEMTAPTAIDEAAEELVANIERFTAQMALSTISAGTGRVQKGDGAIQCFLEWETISRVFSFLFVSRFCC